MTKGDKIAYGLIVIIGGYFAWRFFFDGKGGQGLPIGVPSKFEPSRQSHIRVSYYVKGGKFYRLKSSPNARHRPEEISKEEYLTAYKQS
jgi:hypothetical protein